MLRIVYHHHNRLMAVLTVFSIMLLYQTAFAQSAGIDPQAEKLMRAATTYLAGQNRFSVDTRSTIEVVLASGQKIQFDHGATLAVQRPNKLRAERKGDLIDQVFYYDGKSLTLHNPSDNYYAVAPAPGTVEEMLDFARESLDIIAPAGDLLYKNAFEILMADVTSGFVVGQSVVEDQHCDHLAFRSPEVDWQIWIQEGSQPLPRKLVITTKDVAGMPQFAVVMTHWELAPTFTEAIFDFTPPPDAKQVSFMSLDQSAPLKP
ncbi:MAG: DUF2092 domain-containing protein [Desulfobacterales bacterium]